MVDIAPIIMVMTGGWFIALFLLTFMLLTVVYVIVRLLSEWLLGVPHNCSLCFITFLGRSRSKLTMIVEAMAHSLLYDLLLQMVVFHSYALD